MLVVCHSDLSGIFLMPSQKFVATLAKTRTEIPDALRLRE
jgi:hypothetical protein